MRRRILSLLAAACLAVPAAGCGGEGGIGEAASAALSPYVHATRVAAQGGDRDGALAQIAALRQKVGELRAAGEVSTTAAGQVLEAALDVERQLRALPAPTPPPQHDAPGRVVAPDRGDRDDDEQEDEQEKVEEEARKRAEEAAKKAEEEAKKRAEEERKRAEEADKDKED